MSDLVGQVQRTGAGFSELVRGIRDDQWDAPTPCPEWDVAALVRHMVVGNRIFTGVLAGAPVSPQALAEEFSSHGANLLPGDVDGSVADLAEAFGQPEVMQRPVAIPLGTVPGEVAAQIRVVEQIVHGWDLLTATGQGSPYEEADVQTALDFSRRFLGLVPEGRTPFAEPQPVTEDAPLLDQLVALLGRRPD